MLRESEHLLKNLSGALKDLDIAPFGGWIGVIGRQSLSFSGREVELPQPCMYPQVAATDSETAVVVDSRTRYLEKNAWVVTSSGEVKAQFYAGDAVQDLLATDTFIAVTYFDESALGGEIESNGVNIFDLDGNLLFGYTSFFAGEAVDIADCYCACLAGKNRVLFSPYTEFPLVSLDVRMRTQKIWRIPENLAGSDALTTLGDKVYFHSPYSDEHGIYEWQFDSEVANKIGSYSGRLRGLSGGSFLAVGKNGYTVLSPPERRCCINQGE